MNAVIADGNGIGLVGIVVVVLIICAIVWFARRG